MKVKRYVVDDLPEAVQQIRSELGSDAVILNTKEIRIGGFLGMFRKKRMEVIAAIDETSQKPPSRPVRRPVPAAAPEAFADAPPSVLPADAVRQRYAKPGFAETVGGGERPAQAEAEKPLSEKPVHAAAAAAMALAMQALEERKTQERNEAEAPPPVQEPIRPQERAGVQAQTQDEASALLQELRTMKEMMTKLAKQQSYRTMPDSVIKLSRRLAGQGVEPAYVEQFAEEVTRMLDGQDDELLAYEAAQSVLLSWLQHSRGPGIGPSTRIVHFVGPTGVGKTTTIAKLAAEQSLAHRRSVGFITADTYRIAAVDQLRTYADILNVPLEVVFSQSELVRAYRKLSDSDLVFMDTAGRNYRNELFVSEVNSLLAPGERTETILVLSMTHKYSDMKLVSGQFAKYGVQQLLLTKFDETDTYGSVINLVREFSFQISYITYGQTVPDDIREYDPADLVRRVLGEPAHE